MIKIEHVVHYYETDKMGVVHHSNYIRWFEDARIAWLDACGTPYDYVESRGVISPVVGIEADYKYPSRFGDTVTVQVYCTKYNGVRLEYAYELSLPDGTVVATGKSRHCFQEEGKTRPVSMLRNWPDMHEKILLAHEADLKKLELLAK